MGLFGKSKDEKRKAKQREYSKVYYQKNKDTIKVRKGLHEGLSQTKESRKIKVQQLKKEVFTVYSKHHSNSNVPYCRCCELNEHLDFLTVDHIDGRKTRPKKEQGLLGANLNRWLKKNNYPPGFQILCFNCNATKGFFGSCPHEKMEWINQNVLLTYNSKQF